ncbi:MAG: alpha-glucoside transport system substrate-binding protein [Frankiaceae bacterium]|jgi:spermidine/putrescine-binding protein|nr:alpha-glucoside transport system substrate-binding protein [Frankiaceae bacterium]
MKGPTMHRRLSTVGLVAVLALGATACNSSSPKAGPSASASTSASPTAVNLTGVTLEVAAEWQKDEQKSFQAVLTAFEQKTGAKIKYTSTGNDTATILGTRVAGGNPPDVALIPQPGLIQQFVDKSAAKPLPQSVQDIVKANYAQTWQDLGTFNGSMYAVWFKAANKSTVWYRPETFTTAGVTEPKTWDEFVKTLGTLRDAGVTPLSVGGADGWTLTDWFENVYVRSAGADMYDKLTKHEIPWTDPSVTQALTLLADVWKVKSLLAPNALQTTFPDSVTQVFGTKKAAVVYEGDFVAGVISGSTKAKVGTDAKFFAFPNVGTSPASVIGGGDAAVMMKDSPGAVALMEFLAGPEAADIWVKLGGFTSPNKSVPAADYPDDTSRAIADLLVNAAVFKFDMSDLAPSQFGGTPGQGEWKDLQTFLGNPTAVTATAAKLEADAKAAYKK